MMRAGFYILLFVTVSEPQRQSNPIGFKVPPNVGEQSGQHSGPIQGPIIVHIKTDAERMLSQIKKSGGLTQTPQQHQQPQQQQPTINSKPDEVIASFHSLSLFDALVAHVHASKRTNKDVKDCVWDLNQVNAAIAKCHMGSFLTHGEFVTAAIFNCVKRLRDANLRDYVTQGGMDMDEMRRAACVKTKSRDIEGLWNDTMKPVPDRDCDTEFTKNLAVKCAEGCTGFDTATADENERAKALMKWCVPKSSENMLPYWNQCNSGSETYMSFVTLVLAIVIAFCYCICMCIICICMCTI